MVDFLRAMQAQSRAIGTALLLFSLVISFSACEKDDICVDGDTPLLVIRFYDIQDSSATKNVPSLRVVGLGQNVTVNTVADRSSLDSIAIPLQPGFTSTSFILIRNSADEDSMETGNADTLQFNYETREVFVSRACGFVAHYTGLNTVLQADTNNWILETSIETTEVESQTQAHVKIFH